MAEVILLPDLSFLNLFSHDASLVNSWESWHFSSRILMTASYSMVCAFRAQHGRPNTTLECQPLPM
eukprot:14392547-Alexandrium_andersonii.AAC.1